MFMKIARRRYLYLGRMGGQQEQEMVEVSVYCAVPKIQTTVASAASLRCRKISAAEWKAASTFCR